MDPSNRCLAEVWDRKGRWRKIRWERGGRCEIRERTKHYKWRRDPSVGSQEWGIMGGQTDHGTPGFVLWWSVRFRAGQGKITGIGQAKIRYSVILFSLLPRWLEFSFATGRTGKASQKNFCHFLFQLFGFQNGACPFSWLKKQKKNISTLSWTFPLWWASSKALVVGGDLDGWPSQGLRVCSAEPSRLGFLRQLMTFKPPVRLSFHREVPLLNTTLIKPWTLWIGQALNALPLQESRYSLHKILALIDWAGLFKSPRSKMCLLVVSELRGAASKS